MNFQDSEYPILRAFAPIYKQRRAVYDMIQAKNAGKVKVVEDFLRKLIDESDFSMCVPADVIGEIIESDYIKNSIETGKQGTTTGGQEVRIQALENIYGVGTNGIAPEDFPKYGILTGTNKLRDLARDPDIFYHYGAVMINLKKENLMDRTTLTVGSSLNFDESKLKTPVPVSEPRALCIKGFPTQPLKPGARIFLGLEFMHHLIMDEELSAQCPNTLAMKADDMPGFENFELQFHGRLQFSKDVKSITVCQLKGNEMEILGKYSERLRELGIEVSELFG